MKKNTKEKKCTRCNNLKLINEFYKQIQRGEINRQQWEYRDSMCKKCRIIYSCERSRKIKKQCIEYLGGKCLHCGLIDDQVVYDFHHLDPKTKEFNLSKKNIIFEKAKKELDKCILLCSNCHRKLHKNS